MFLSMGHSWGRIVNTRGVPRASHSMIATTLMEYREELWRVFTLVEYHEVDRDTCSTYSTVVDVGES